MFPRIRTTTSLLLLAVMTTTVVAEDATNALVDELRREFKRAEKERLADPWFLRDLEQIVNKYDQPWGQTVLNSPFNGPERLPAAPWRVRSGEFLIDWRLGLRSVVRPHRTTEHRTAGDKEELAKALVGALLERVIDTGDADRTSTERSSKASEVAWLQAKARFSNAFLLSFKISQRQLDGNDRGEFMIGPITRQEPEGYRLFLQPGQAKGEASMQLVRYSANGGVGVIDRIQTPLRLADGKSHELIWTRDRNGQMQISIDGKTLLQGPDRSIGSRFDGLELSNKGGDFAIRDLVLKAAR